MSLLQSAAELLSQCIAFLPLHTVVYGSRGRVGNRVHFVAVYCKAMCRLIDVMAVPLLHALESRFSRCGSRISDLEREKRDLEAQLENEAQTRRDENTDAISPPTSSHRMTTVWPHHLCYKYVVLYRKLIKEIACIYIKVRPRNYLPMSTSVGAVVSCCCLSHDSGPSISWRFRIIAKSSSGLFKKWKSTLVKPSGQNLFRNNYGGFANTIITNSKQTDDAFDKKHIFLRRIFSPFFSDLSHDCSRGFSHDLSRDLARDPVL